MSSYPIEHDAAEIRRLELQAKRYDDPTRRLLALSGLMPGMRVLDVGTGPGDVAMLAAEIVKSSGWVLGVDLNADVLVRAGDRAAAAGLTNLHFKTTTLDDLDEPASFDLVIGRLVLGFQSDKLAFVRRCAALVRPGGKLAFLEPAASLNLALSNPPVPLYDLGYNLCIRAAEAGGFPMISGGMLHGLFVDAGLGKPDIFCDVSVGSADSTAIELIISNIDILRPSMKRTGIDVPDELNDLNLRARMVATATETRSQLYGIPVIGAVAGVEI